MLKAGGDCEEMNGLPKPLPRTAKLLVTTEPPVGIEPTTYSGQSPVTDLDLHWLTTSN